MTTNFDDILERIKKATGARTQVELATILNIRQSSISDAKRRNSVPADWYLKLYRSHGLNPDWLHEGMDPMYLKPGMSENASSVVLEQTAAYGRSSSRSRVVNVSSMSGQTMENGLWRPDYVAQLAIPETYHRPGLLVLRMDGSSMEPLVRRGGFVGLDTEQKRVLSGEIYGVLVPHEGLVLKRIFFDAELNRFVLRSENPGHPEQWLNPEDRDTRIKGRAVWVIQEL